MRAADLKAVKGGESALAMAKRRNNTVLNLIFMVDLKSKNLHMGTHKGQNSYFFKMPEFRPFLRV